MTRNRSRDVQTIHLLGVPYQQEVDGLRVDCSETLNALAGRAGYLERLENRVEDVATRELIPLYDGGYYALDEVLKHGGELSFSQAYSLGTFVCMALNNPIRNAILARADVPGYPIHQSGGSSGKQSIRETQLMQATSLLSQMSTKEGYVGLSPDEIAGVVAATIDLDTVVRTKSDEPIVALGGMGGDRGYGQVGHQSKLFSLSTLSSLVLGVDGKTHKHHSYPNTSKVAGQSAIEALGARSDFHSPKAFDRVLSETGLVMSSCHNTRTLHTLSHRLKGETINHIIGPLAFTVDAASLVQGFIGVNEKIHPATVIRTLERLTAHGFQEYDNSVAFFGTNTENIDRALLDESGYYASRAARAQVAIDEIAPPPFSTVASFMRAGQYAGTYEIRPYDFFEPKDISRMGIHDLMIPNSVERILQANREALSGEDVAKAMYLAMNAGLGIFVRKYLDKADALDEHSRRVNSTYLRQATAEAFGIILSGSAVDKLHEYVDATRRNAGEQGV